MQIGGKNMKKYVKEEVKDLSFEELQKKYPTLKINIFLK